MNDVMRSLAARVSEPGSARSASALLLALFASSVCSSQSTPTVLSPGTVVIGQCAGHTNEPACVLPNLFGPQGITLYPSPSFPHYAHFIGSAQTVMNQTLSSAIGTQLATLPFISPASGFTYQFDTNLGVFARSTNSFGPIYSERAETIGRGRVSFGVSYQRFRFGRLDGLNLHDIPAVFTHVPLVTAPGATPLPFQYDVIKTSNNIDLNLDQAVVFASVGITDRLEVSVAMPLSSVRMGASSSADIVRVSGQSFTSGGTVFPNPHSFTSDPNSLHNAYSSTGTASGLGDVTLRIKDNVIQREGYRIALGLDIRAPTGAARKYLGTGAVGLKPFVVVSAGKRLSPHANFGFQWNGQSVLAGDVTGTTADENSAGQATIQNGPAVSHNLPREVLYSFGADYGATKSLTLAADYLGQTVFDAPGIAADTFITQNIAGGTGPIPIPTIKATVGYLYLNTASLGFKYELLNNLLLTGNLLVKLDNNGLRQNVTPLVALSYAFGH
jgi:hypothetical protein